MERFHYNVSGFYEENCNHKNVEYTTPSMYKLNFLIGKPKVIYCFIILFFNESTFPSTQVLFFERLDRKKINAILRYIVLLVILKP